MLAVVFYILLFSLFLFQSMREQPFLSIVIRISANVSRSFNLWFDLKIPIRYICAYIALIYVYIVFISFASQFPVSFSLDRERTLLSKYLSLLPHFFDSSRSLLRIYCFCSFFHRLVHRLITENFFLSVVKNSCWEKS